MWWIASGGGGGSNDNNQSGGGNRAPVANAGSDQNVSTGSPMTLDGSGSSDVDGDTLTYSWSFTSVPAGSGITNTDLSDSTAVNPTSTPDKDGLYMLTLVVNDGTVTDNEAGLMWQNAARARQMMLRAPVLSQNITKYQAVGISNSLYNPERRKT